ncbi:MAG TPA: MBL fold metallo-hydrolase [Povalibacter sp.]|uniref:MBL fold metallo-hydrolase n=1 Tax=Povalibacter sp. TaxID=1962978 RepID=UPI002C6B2F6F|nr:MBL fold metallo-hydrolase [Povalibacter sp.]HMN45584.1 MBL fold metallo-hydrolase [Povalibacter sp.]
MSTYSPDHPQQFVQQLAHDISVIDTGFVHELFDASHLIVGNGRAAYVDTGTNNSVPRLLAALEYLGLDRSAVDYVILTHVHLDHAGGAGLLMQQLPNAKLVVHPRGARHMIDPTKLMEGVRGVYGAEIAARDYGELVPVAADRVLETHDDLVLELGDRPLRFAETPGHALHHDCIWDEASRGWFTGDTLGLAYPALTTPRGRHVIPATAPVQFDPPALRASIERMLRAQPQVLYLTHYGAVGNPENIAQQLLSQVDAMVEAALELAAAPDRHARLKAAFQDIYMTELRRCGSTDSDEKLHALLATDVELNAQGVGVWLDKAKR